MRMAEKREILRTGWRDAAGILLVALAMLVLLSLGTYRAEDIPFNQNPPNAPAANFIGPMGAWTAFLLYMAFGVSAWFAPLGFLAAGLFLLFQREGRFWPKWIWLLAGQLALSVLMDLGRHPWAEWVRRVNVPSPGGLLGEVIAGKFLVRFLGAPGAAILAAAVLLAGLILVVEVHPWHVLRQAGALFGWLAGKGREWREARRERKQVVDDEQREIMKRRQRLEDAMREAAQRRTEGVRPPSPAVRPVSPGPAPRSEPPVPAAEKEPPPEKDKSRVRPRPPPREPPPPAAPAIPSSYHLPSLDLLEPLPAAADRAIEGDSQGGADILKETMSEFGVEVDVTNVERGPVVTRYELLPAPGVRVERIAALSNNIALAMKAESVRVQAPIPGKGVVGIEVPNAKTTKVFLREILESASWRGSSAGLPLALGKDVGGRDLVSDLSDMPHLLIAGATGSGKTVCMNSILAGLLMSRTPEQMRLMLIDPKIVEFSVYNNLPHLVVPVITDPKKVGIGLRWAITEMEKRYKLFARVGVRNITAYNQRPIFKQAELFEPPAGEQEAEADRPPDRLPYIVIIVDELADLMLVAQAEVENYIARLAQLSRAVGIHMILATQRPSVNVITGTIKANFPARISFQVAQKVDSRTILDANGADKLLGKGDLLFLPPGSSKLIRAQGTLTADVEIRRLTDFWRQQGTPDYVAAVKEKIEGSAPDIPELEEDDELLEAAVEIIRQTQRASTSSLQRRLRIGYTRAARLMDLLEQRGVVGPPSGADPREILVDLDGEIPQSAPGDED